MFWILLVATLITYYKNNLIANIIMFIIVLAYCIFTNMSFLKKIAEPVINKFKK